MTPESFLCFADLLPEPMLLVTADGCVLAANRSAAQRFGVPRAELAGQALDRWVEEPASWLRECLRACTRTRGMVPSSLTFILANGERLACRVEGALFQPRTNTLPARVLLRLQPKPEAPSQFAVLNERITALNHEILQRKRVEQELREQREWFRVVLSSIGDGVIATDSRGHVLFLNGMAELLTGWKGEEAAGRPLDEVFHIINEHTRQPVENPVHRVLAQGIVVGLANDTLLVCRRGREWPIADSAAPIRDVDGKILGVVLVFLEITERKRVEMQLREQARELAEADRRKDQYLAMLAHELRNPLGAVSNALSLMELSVPGSTGFQRSLEIARRHVHQQTRMVDDLLDVSRLTRGTFELHPERLDLAALCRQAAEDQQAAFAAVQVTFLVSVPREPLWVVGDPVRLTQVLVNLLNNARKFTPAEGTVRLELRSDPHSRSARVVVADTGVGIDRELLPHVFEPFRQAEQSLARTHGGLGLGLALVKGIVDLHGGQVSVESSGDGGGTAFTVTLPLARGAAPRKAPVEEILETTQALRVLIIEDNPDAAETLQELVALWGHATAVAHSGPEGIRRAAEFRPQVVLCDIGLPHMSGYEVAARLRQDPVAGSAYLVAVTGYGQDQDRAQSAAAGFHTHLVKPLDLNALEQLLARLSRSLPR